VSLFFHRRSIARAVAGQLSPDAERALREHLRGCTACREHYDNLAQVTEAFALAAGRGDTRADDRARARLMAALPGAGAVAAAEPRPARVPRWTWGAVGLIPALALAVFFLRPAPKPYQAMRGGGDATEPSAPAALLIFASRKDAARGHGPVRLVAELPASGEGRVSLEDYVQFSVRGLHAPAFVTVVGVDDAGEVHTYVPRAGTPPPRPAPSASATSLGASIDLAPGHRPGRLRIYGLLSAEPLSPERVRAAAARLDRTRPGAPALDLAVPQVAGLLIIEP
jgi:anti-sigma factor RsiW